MTWLLKSKVQVNNIVKFVRYLTENSASSLQRAASTLFSANKAVSCMNRIVLSEPTVLLLQQQAVGLRTVSTVLGSEPVVRGHLGVRDAWPLNLLY